jgi:hypothetical protein
MWLELGQLVSQIVILFLQIVQSVGLAVFGNLKSLDFGVFFLAATESKNNEKFI